MQWSLEKIHLKLKSQWSIHGGSVKEKVNHIVKLKRKDRLGLGEISASTKNNDFKLINNDLNKIDLKSIDSLRKIQRLKVCPQVKHGFELAWISTELLEKDINLNDYLNIKNTVSAPTNYSIPIMPIKDIGPYIEKNSVNEYNSCKVKINGVNSNNFIKEVTKYYKGPLRIDANECFLDARSCLRFINSCHEINIDFLEQPLHRTNIKEAQLLKKESPWLIVGDESLQDGSINEQHSKCFDGLNIKLMKSGGPIKALKQIKDCKTFNLKVLIGCMVESSLNISTALKLGCDADWFDLDGCLLLEKDPFNLVKINNGNIRLISKQNSI